MKGVYSLLGLYRNILGIAREDRFCSEFNGFSGVCFIYLRLLIEDLCGHIFTVPLFPIKWWGWSLSNLESLKTSHDSSFLKRIKFFQHWRSHIIFSSAFSVNFKKSFALTLQNNHYNFLDFFDTSPSLQFPHEGPIPQQKSLPLIKTPNLYLQPAPYPDPSNQPYLTINHVS